MGADEGARARSNADFSGYLASKFADGKRADASR